jgi:hypothetical protein
MQSISFMKILSLVLVLVLFLLPCLAVAQNQDRPSISVGKITGHILIDGQLDEPAWIAAEKISDLYTTEPVEGGQPSGRTSFSLIADSKNLIIGVNCEYEDPSQVVSFSKLRDTELNNEDHVRIVIDPFLDGLSGYIFVVNANGARYDALVANRGESENSNWDAIWEAKTTRHQTGWSLEIRIPMQSISFTKGLDRWGFNIERRIQSNQETIRWANVKIDQWFIQTSKAGFITGIPAFSYGVGLNIKPSVILEMSRHGTEATDYDFEPSLDAGQRIGPNIQANLTINTDFAETEVDTRQTNLDRFPLFFPEKRAFFLEGADIFEFGFGLGRQLIPFFSRRIGLYEGGRIGKTAFGGLVMNTQKFKGEDFELSNSTTGVLRVRQNVFASSSVGMISTFGAPDGHRSYTGGLDFTYQTTTLWGDKNFIVGLWGLISDQESLNHKEYSAGFKVDYPNDKWDVSFTLMRIGEEFDSALGFVPRKGIYYIRPAATYSPRPKWSFVRQMRHQFFPSIYLDLDGNWQTYRVFTAPINWRLESGDRIEANWMPRGERLTEDFEIADGVVIPAGEYHFHRWRFEGELAAKRRFSGRALWWFGSFYEGTLHEIEANLLYSPSSLIQLELAGQQNIGRLPWGNFDQTLIGVRLRLNITPDLQLNCFPQYDTSSREFGLNARLHWIYKSQGDFFIVYNHNTLFGEVERMFISNQLLVKARYNFRL